MPTGIFSTHVGGGASPLQRVYKSPLRVEGRVNTPDGGRDLVKRAI